MKLLLPKKARADMAVVRLLPGIPNSFCFLRKGVCCPSIASSLWVPFYPGRRRGWRRGSDR